MLWFLFFFAVFIGLALLFIIGTNAGVSQKVSSEDACDPYALKTASLAVTTTADTESDFFHHQDPFIQTNSGLREEYMAMSSCAYAAGDLASGAMYADMAASEP